MEALKLSGLRFGRLLVQEKLPSRKDPDGTPRTMWMCRCDCGQERPIRQQSLRSGRAQSCGCIRIERVKKGIHWKYTTDAERAASLVRRKAKQASQVRLKKYGVTDGDWSAMLESQDHRCAICRKHQSESTFHVDHEHVDGFKEMPTHWKRHHVRGLLCVHCNALLGMARDDAAVLQRAINYLQSRS